MKTKVIHLIYQTGDKSQAVCSYMVGVRPIETVIGGSDKGRWPKGTYNAHKITCKRCKKSVNYKIVIALDKLKNPLLYWKENI